jgi:hypothetical protein
MSSLDVFLCLLAAASLPAGQLTFKLTASDETEALGIALHRSSALSA